MRVRADRAVRVSPARWTAAEILTRVATAEAFAANLLASNLTEKLSPEDRALAHELVLGVLRHQRRIDYFLAKLSGREPARLDLAVLVALRLGFYQLKYLTRIPVRAAVNESVNLTKLHGKRSAAGFVNAVLRKAADVQTDEIEIDDEIDRIAVAHSHPEWLARRWAAHYGKEWLAALCAANNRSASIDFRINELAALSHEEILAELTRAGIETVSGRFTRGYRVVSGNSAALLPFATRGLIHIQDEASQLVAALVDAKPGMRVLDACAAPGGKTTAIAAAMENRGLICAGELHQSRARLVAENSRRLQADIIAPICYDAARSLPLTEIYFDRILIDAPCTGTGTLRRNPEIKWRLTPEKVLELAALQQRILANVAPRLAVGGRLVYSTCSLEKEEDEDVIEQFLAAHPQFRLAAPAVPAELLTPAGYVRTWPQRDDTDGFFAAVLTRTG